jgi:hypothetical protein
MQTGEDAAAEVSSDASPDAGLSGAAPPTHEHEPPGFTEFTERPFSALVEDGWLEPRLLADAGATPILTILSDQTAPKSPPNVLSILYPPGLAGGDSPFAQEKDISGSYTQFYGCIWIKLSSDFVGNGSGVNKILYVWTNDPPYGQPAIYLSAQAVGSSMGFQPQIRTQDAISQDKAPNVAGQTGYTFLRDTWVRWEWLLILNSPGSVDVDAQVANGVIRVWMNGVQTHEYDNVEFSTNASQRVWTELQIAPYWGGTGGAIETDQYLYIDHLYASVN